MLCYGLKSRPSSSTQMEYEISHDPRSSVFFSTCYQKQTAVEFAGIPDPGFQSSKQFLFDDKCLSCASSATNAQKGVPATDMVRGNVSVEPGAFTPTWKLAEKCIDCIASPGKPDKLPQIAARERWGDGERKITCLGMRQHVDAGASVGRLKSADCANAICAKLLVTPGRGHTRHKLGVAFNIDHCKALAARDSECNDDLIFFANDFAVTKVSRTSFKEGHVCICMKKNTCCSGCTPAMPSHSHGKLVPILFQTKSTPWVVMANAHCKTRDRRVPNGKPVGPSHPVGLGDEGCKAACDQIEDCNRAVYDTKYKKCYTNHVSEVPNRCDSNRDRWTYYKRKQGTTSLMQVGAHDTLTEELAEDASDSEGVGEIEEFLEEDERQELLEDELQTAALLEGMDAAIEADDEGIAEDDEHDENDVHLDHEDHMCDGHAVPEYTSFATDYLREIGQDLRNISQWYLPGSFVPFPHTYHSVTHQSEEYALSRDQLAALTVKHRVRRSAKSKSAKRHDKRAIRRRRHRFARRRRRAFRSPRRRHYRVRKTTTPAPTSTPTPATKPPTQAPTEAPTKPPTKPPTKAPTEAPTKPPTKPPRPKGRRRRAPTTMPPTTEAPTTVPPTTEAPPSPPTNPGHCIKLRSLAACSRCLETVQCTEGICDPIMKRCVASRGQVCPEPVAECNPPCSKPECTSCVASYPAKWQKPTCGRQSR